MAVILFVEETTVPGKNPPTCLKSLTNFAMIGIQTHNMSAD
jgi:hypothetical protein